MKLTKGDKLFSAANVLFVTVFSLLVVYPFWYIISVSLTPHQKYLDAGGLILYPLGFSLKWYKFLLLDSTFVLHAYGNTILYTVVGTSLALFLTVTSAYGLSQKNLPGRKFLIIYNIIPWFFTGGLIPTFITLKSIGLFNTRAGYILLLCYFIFYMLIMKSFFEQIPASYAESGYIDGASEFTILLRIILPLSRAALATISLFYIVVYWNNFFAALIYLRKSELKPVQVVLYEIVQAAQLPPDMLDVAEVSNIPIPLIRAVSIVVVGLPMMVIYPFIQRYFNKGIQLGGLKA